MLNLIITVILHLLKLRHPEIKCKQNNLWLVSFFVNIFANEPFSLKMYIIGSSKTYDFCMFAHMYAFIEHILIIKYNV